MEIIKGAGSVLKPTTVHWSAEKADFAWSPFSKVDLEEKFGFKRIMKIGRTSDLFSLSYDICSSSTNHKTVLCCDWLKKDHMIGIFVTPSLHGTTKRKQMS